MQKLAPRFLFAAFAVCVNFCHAQTPHIDLSGFIPGQTPRASASAFALAHPDWALSEPAESNWSNALANDCSLGPQGLWICFAKAAAGTVAEASIEVQYAGPAAPLAERRLGLARVSLVWKAPWTGGWKTFLDSRPAPASEGSLPAAKGRALWSSAFPGTAAPSGCEIYRAARWMAYDTEGNPTAISALALIDVRGALCALTAETSAKGWGVALRTAPIAEVQIP